MIEITDALIIAVIMGLVELIKRTEKIPVQYLPFISLVLGVISGVVYFDGLLKEKILIGIVAGLIASGVFDNFKSVGKFFKKEDKGNG